MRLSINPIYIAIIVILTITSVTAITTIASNISAQVSNTKLVTDLDYNVHFKTACISVIFFTYCW